MVIPTSLKGKTYFPYGRPPFLKEIRPEVMNTSSARDEEGLWPIPYPPQEYSSNPSSTGEKSHGLALHLLVK